MKDFNLKEKLKKVDKLFFVFIVLLMAKSLLFLAMLHGKDSATLNISRMYFSPPPIICHILFVILLVSFGLWFVGRGRLYYYIIIDLLFSLLLIGDLISFRAYGGFLSLSQVIVPQSFNPSNKALFSYLHLIDILFIVDCILFIVYSLKNRKFYKGMFRNIKFNIISFFIIFLVSIGVIGRTHYLIDIKDVTKGDQIFLKVCWAQFQTMSNMSPAGYHIYDVYLQFTDNKNKTLTENDKKEIDTWFKENNEDLPDNEYLGKLKGKNVIFLQVESLENFVIGEKVNNQEITPNLNKMLGNSIYFPNTYEQVNNGTSSDGDFISINSIYPIRQGTVVYRYPNNTYTSSIAEMLKEQGYTTVSTHPEKAFNWNWRPNHRSFGFDKSYDINDYVVDEEIGPGISDGSFFKQTMNYMDKEKNPHFLHAVTLTSHGPFEMPEKERALKLDKEFDESIMGSYFQSVNYVDRQIGNLVNMLKERNELDNTVLVIYGDHTGVHKFYQDKVNDIKNMEEKWREKDLRVPFIIYNPELNGEKKDVIGGQVDMMPTVAYLMGIERDRLKDSAMGRILVNTQRNSTILNNGDIIGEPKNKEEENHIKSVFSIADKIIEGNYFKNNK